MASLYQRNGNYYGVWFDTNRRPKKKRHSLRTTNKRTARRLLAAADDAYRLGRWDPWVDPISVLDERPQEVVTLAHAVTVYLKAKERTLRPPTVATYRSTLRRLQKSVGGQTPVARLSPADVDAFACDSNLAASTQRLRHRVLRAFCRWTVREGHVEKSPTERVTPPPQPARVPKAVKPDELEAICAAVEADYRARLTPSGGGRNVKEGDVIWMIPLFWFAFYTGLRASELARLRWGHIDSERKLIVIEVQKNKSAGTIPLNAKAAEVLERVERREAEDYVFTSPQGADLRERSVKSFVNVISRAFTRYRKAAGIKRRLTFHSTRHGFATALASHGKSAWVIQAACRHSSITVSQLYVSLANEHLKNELDEVFG